MSRSVTNMGPSWCSSGKASSAARHPPHRAEQRVDLPVRVRHAEPRTHRTGKRHDRVAFAMAVNEILQAHHMPLLRLPTTGSGEDQRIRQALDDAEGHWAQMSAR